LRGPETDKEGKLFVRAKNTDHDVRIAKVKRERRRRDTNRGDGDNGGSLHQRE
jgi:hypothetical protein